MNDWCKLFLGELGAGATLAGIVSVSPSQVKAVN
jgi:hypothetical protein